MGAQRIAVFSAQYLPNIGGVEKYTDNLARELARSGYDVTIVTSNAHGLAGHEELSPQVEVVRLPCFPLIGGRMPVPRKNGEFERLWNVVESRDYCGVLVNTRFYLHSLWGLKLAKRKRLRAVVCEHGSAYLTFGNALLDKAVVAYEHLMTSRVKRYDPDFYAVSSKGVEWLRTFGIEGRGVLSNAIDAQMFRSSASDRAFRAEFGIADDALLVSFVGRFIPEKGVDALIDAMALLEQRGVNAVVLMAGGGPLEERIARAEARNIVVVGRLDAPDVAALMVQSDVFCLPTRSEGFSTSLLEASATSTPAIITDVGGVAEMIPDASFGTVLPDAQPATIADAIEHAACHREELACQGQRCFERVSEHFSWACTAQAVVEACKRAQQR